MIPNCHRHRWDESEDECRECGDAFCASCLVYVNGANARPLCINCALKKSGVRGSRRTGPSRRERRARAKVAKVHDRARVSLDASRWDVGAI